MSKELNVPVLCLSQLSRVVEEREDKRPVLSDLRGSGPFVPEADIVLFLYQGCYYHEKMKKSDMMECIVAKNVYGESGTVELRWRPKAIGSLFRIICAVGSGKQCVGIYPVRACWWLTAPNPL